MQIRQMFKIPRSLLYGERIEEADGGWGPQYEKKEGSNEHSRKNWLTHMYELIDQYEPELLYIF